RPGKRAPCDTWIFQDRHPGFLAVNELEYAGVLTCFAKRSAHHGGGSVREFRVPRVGFHNHWATGGKCCRGVSSGNGKRKRKVRGRKVNDWPQREMCATKIWPHTQRKLGVCLINACVQVRAV